MVPVAPLPMTFTIGGVRENETGRNLVQIVISSPSGVFIAFLDADAAIETGQNLFRIGRESKNTNGIVIPITKIPKDLKDIKE